MANIPDAVARLERLNRELHSLRFRCGEPARSAQEVDRRIAEGERIAAEIRAVFRGGPSGH